MNERKLLTRNLFHTFHNVVAISCTRSSTLRFSVSAFNWRDRCSPIWRFSFSISSAFLSESPGRNVRYREQRATMKDGNSLFRVPRLREFSRFHLVHEPLPLLFQLRFLPLRGHPHFLQIILGRPLTQKPVQNVLGSGHSGRPAKFGERLLQPRHFVLARVLRALASPTRAVEIVPWTRLEYHLLQTLELHLSLQHALPYNTLSFNFIL